MPVTALIRRARVQAGFAVPVAIMVLVLVLAFAGVAVRQSLRALDASHRGVDDKRALQAALAGMRMATYEANGLRLDLNQLLKPSQQCIVHVGLSGVTGVPLVTGALSFTDGLVTGGWCPAVSADLGNGASYSYRMSQVANVSGEALSETMLAVLRRRVVAIGTVCRPVRTPCAPGDPGSTSRRVFREITASGRNERAAVLSLLGLEVPQPGVLGSTSLELYRPVDDSFRECPGEVLRTPPDAGC